MVSPIGTGRTILGYSSNITTDQAQLPQLHDGAATGGGEPLPLRTLRAQRMETWTCWLS